MSPALSVLLPCRDAAPWLPECIASLEGQAEGEFEVLAVDDGSADGTRALLAAWAARDRRVRVLDGAGRGIVAALRRSAGAARAPLLARMDADDVAHPERLAAQRRLLDRDPGLAGCGTGFRYFPRDRLRSGYRRYERWLNGLRTPEQVRRDLFVECPVAHPTLVLRRSAYEAAGGYRDVPWPEDYDLVLRLHRGGARLANVGRRLLRWRVRPDRLSMRSERYAADAFRRCKARFLAGGFLPPDRPLVVWGAGRVGKRMARALIGEGEVPDAFVDLDPRKVGQRIHGAPVLSPEALAARVLRSLAEVTGRPYVLVSVGSPGARQEIREALRRMGLREPEDYRAVA